MWLNHCLQFWFHVLYHFSSSNRVIIFVDNVVNSISIWTRNDANKSASKLIVWGDIAKWWVIALSLIFEFIYFWNILQCSNNEIVNWYRLWIFRVWKFSLTNVKPACLTLHHVWDWGIFVNNKWWNVTHCKNDRSSWTTSCSSHISNDIAVVFINEMLPQVHWLIGLLWPI